MVNQSSVLVKFDGGVVDSLDCLCKELGCKRNRLINFACRVMIENMSDIGVCRLTSVYASALSELL